MNVGNLGSSASATLLGLRNRHRADQGSVIPTANATAPTTSSPSASAGNPLSLQGFQKTWGSNDPTYDLNADGKVDIEDISQWIADLVSETGDTANEQTQPTDDAAQNPPASATSPLTREGFTRAWGTSDTSYDVNRDGTVNIDDLTQWVMNADAAAQPVDHVDPDLQTASADEIASDTGLLDSPSATPEADTPAPTTGDPTGDMQPWQQAWGQTGDYDFNHDGTVNIDDLTQWVLSQSSPNTQNKPLEVDPVTPPEQTPTPESVAVTRRENDPSIVRASKTVEPAGIGNNLIGRLRKNSGSSSVISSTIADSLAAKTRTRTTVADDNQTNISKLAAQVISKLQVAPLPQRGFKFNEDVMNR